MTKEILKVKRKQLESLAAENGYCEEGYDWWNNTNDENDIPVIFEEISKEVTDVNRWTLDYEKVIKRADGKYFKIWWSEPATETCGYFNDCNYKEEYEFEEVFPVTKTITVYE